MYFVSVTRLRLRSFRFLPFFLLANEASIRVIKKVDGFMGGKELIDKGLTFWTVTVWQSDQAMKFFRNNDPHKKAMRKLPHWCSEAAYVHWTQEDEFIPDLAILHQRLLAEGKLTKVKFPSKDQPTMAYLAPQRTVTQRQILAVKA